MVTHNTFLDYEHAQCKEIERYIWIKGVELNHDPRDYQSQNDLYLEWILLYAQQFRENNCVK